MLQKYIIYFTIKETCDVYFSQPYSTFNKAKDNIDKFLEDHAKNRGKKVINLSKEELEKLKLSKKPEDCFYVRRKNSEAIVYNIVTSYGTFYNSYSVEKFGKINITEILFKKENVCNGKSDKNEDKSEDNEDKEENFIPEDKIADLHVTNYERGAHVSFVSELKNVLNSRKLKDIKIKPENDTKEEKEKDIKNNKESPFIASLIEGKIKLRNITPPIPKKHLMFNESKYESKYETKYENKYENKM
jgi:hypothetical protein